MVLRSSQFDDIYFSPDDGLAETNHVFLQGNNLPEAWNGKNRFTVFETGFGTGLNFLSCWSLFEKTANPGQTLDYIAVEKFPLHPDDIQKALARWAPELGERLQRMLAFYPLRIESFHRIHLAENVRLTLLFDDVNTALPDLTVPRGVDAWFLDGFAPAKNPQMWSPTLFENMTRLSHEHTSVATFTAAGAVRRGLQEAGFTVEKRPGFGRKRDMVVAHSLKDPVLRPFTSEGKPPRVAVLGAGLAGLSCGYMLKKAGVHADIYDPAENIASGASGNLLGLYNPRFFALKMPESLYYRSGYAAAYSFFKQAQDAYDIGFQSCGALHLINTPEKDRRFRSMTSGQGWHEDHAQMLAPDQASDIAGMDLNLPALYLPDSGFVSPQKLCAFYAADLSLKLGVQAEVTADDGKWIIEGQEYDAVILANGIAAHKNIYAGWLPLKNVRGQITHVQENGVSAKLKTCLCYGGYMSRSHDGVHVVGSSFQRGRDDVAADPADDDSNLEKLTKAVPGLSGLQISGRQAGLRTTSPDHLPVIGAVPHFGDTIDNIRDAGQKGLFVSTGHGSHGIVSSLTAAVYLTDLITDTPHSLPQSTAKAVCAARFVKTV